MSDSVLLRPTCELKCRCIIAHDQWDERSVLGSAQFHKGRMKGNDPTIDTAQTPMRLDGRLVLLEKIQTTFTDSILNKISCVKTPSSFPLLCTCRVCTQATYLRSRMNKSPDLLTSPMYTRFVKKSLMKNCWNLMQKIKKLCKNSSLVNSRLIV